MTNEENRLFRNGKETGLLIGFFVGMVFALILEYLMKLEIL